MSKRLVTQSIMQYIEIHT